MPGLWSPLISLAPVHQELSYSAAAQTLHAAQKQWCQEMNTSEAGGRKQPLLLCWSSWAFCHGNINFLRRLWDLLRKQQCCDAKTNFNVNGQMKFPVLEIHGRAVKIQF